MTEPSAARSASRLCGGTGAGESGCGRGGIDLWLCESDLSDPSDPSDFDSDHRGSYAII
ncbi:hypothetical protein FJY63_13475 [Candidatus Sumerlaeota bacterium]|nr:hypothetical protein [Candidatus Sumerlaeota bacterium]